MTTEASSLVAAALLAWVALVYLLMASGVRRGELVWAGRYPRRLPPTLRRASLFYAVSLLLSGWVIIAYTGVVNLAPVPEIWLRSAGWVVTVYLGVASGYSLLRGSKWERLLFAPITVLGALLAGYLTFV